MLKRWWRYSERDEQVQYCRGAKGDLQAKIELGAIEDSRGERRERKAEHGLNGEAGELGSESRAEWEAD